MNPKRARTEGIYSSVIDTFEPNDDKSHAVDVSDLECNALIYSFNNGQSQDTDWYTYTGKNFSKIVVTLPDDTPFKDQLEIKIDNGDITSLSPGENVVGYSGTGDLVFQIRFITVDTGINCIGSYKVKVGN